MSSELDHSLPHGEKRRDDALDDHTEAKRRKTRSSTGAAAEPPSSSGLVTLLQSESSAGPVVPGDEDGTGNARETSDEDEDEGDAYEENERDEDDGESEEDEETGNENEEARRAAVRAGVQERLQRLLIARPQLNIESPEFRDLLLYVGQGIGVTDDDILGARRDSNSPRRRA